MMRTILPLVVCASAALAGDPPPPSLEKPVDYVAWRNEEFGRRIRDNAAPLYEEAIREFGDIIDISILVADKSFGEFTADERRQFESWLRDKSAAFDKFAEAAGKRTCLFECKSKDGSLLNVELPPLSPFRNISRILSTRAASHVSEGNCEAAMGDALLILAGARHLRSQPEMIWNLVGIANSSLAYSAIGKLIEGAPQNADWELLYTKLKRGDRTPPNLGGSLTAEIAISFDALQRWARDSDGDGKLDRFSLPAELGGEGDKPLRRPRSISEFADAVRDLNDLLRNAQDLRGGGFRAKLDQYLKLIEDDPDLAQLAGTDRSEIIRRRCDAVRRGTFIAIKLHGYRSKHGKWPESLREAMAGEDPTLCWDPFSDEDLIYRVTGDSFLLYSVGTNGKDDDGDTTTKEIDDSIAGVKFTRSSDPPDIVLWPVED